MLDVFLCLSLLAWVAGDYFHDGRSFCAVKPGGGEIKGEEDCRMY